MTTNASALGPDQAVTLALAREWIAGCQMEWAEERAAEANDREVAELWGRALGVVLLPPLIDVAKKKGAKRAELPADTEPLIDEHAASAYLGYAAITCLRMAKRGQLPSVPFPIGSTGKFRHKFRLSELQAYTASLSHASNAG